MKVNDPEFVCAGPDHDRTVFTLDVGYPEGCPSIPTEVEGANVHNLEIEVSGTPPVPMIVLPVDLAATKYQWEAVGCGARVHYEGSIGTLDVEFAVIDSYEATGAGTWTPAGAEPCEITLAGRYHNWTKRDPEDEEDEEEEYED